MTPVARTAFFVGIYAVAGGMVSLFIPIVILFILALPTTSEVLIRVLGAVAVPLGLYYVQAARAEAEWFFNVSIWGRTFFGLSAIAFVIFGLIRWPLLVFAFIDLSTAAWTGFELRRAGRPLSPLGTASIQR